MNAITKLDADAREVTCEAGVILQTLHEAVAPHGLRFPLTLGSLSCGVHPEALFILHNEKKPSSPFCERRSEKVKKMPESLRIPAFPWNNVPNEDISPRVFSEGCYHFRPV